MKAAKADGRLRQQFPHPLGVRRAHVHENVFHHIGVATMRHQVAGKGLGRFVVASRASEQQTFGVEIMGHRDVFMAALDVGFVDADVANIAHVIFGAGVLDVVVDTRPQPLGSDPQQVRGLGDWHLLTQGQPQCLEQQGETTAFPYPRYGDPGGLAASPTLHTGDIGMQPRFRLEEIEMAPVAPRAVMNALLGRATGGAYAPLGGVQLNLLNFPRCMKAQGRGEQGFNGYAS